MSNAGPLGRGSLWLLVGLVVVGSGFLWLLREGGGREPDGTPPGAVPAVDTSGGPTELEPGRDQERRTAAGDGVATPPDLALGAGAPPVAGRFEGRGTVRGHVEVSGDEPFPATWRLVLSPSNTLVGREHAVERVLDLQGTQDFQVEDLPLAGYDVVARAAGWSGLPQPVLLEARSPDAFVNLRMVRAGFVEGRVLDHRGLPAEDVTVTLTAVLTRHVRETVTDALGGYRFADVEDGAYQVGIGPFHNPLLREPRTVRVEPPGVLLPDVELPPMGALRVRVFDGLDERLLPDVEVIASGTRGGSFERRTDAYGELVVRHLPPGRWRLRLELDGYLSRRDAVELLPGETTEVTLGIGRERADRERDDR